MNISSIAAFTLFAALLALNPASAADSDDLAALIAERDEDHLRRYPSDAITRGNRRFLDRYEENLTTEHLAEGRSLSDDYRMRLAAIASAALSESERISYDVLSWELERERIYSENGLADLEQMLPLDHIYGRHLGFARDMQWASAYPFNTTEDYERAILRMAGFSRWVDQAIVRMREGIRQGIVLPRIVVENIVAQLRPLGETGIEDSGFLGPVTHMPASIIDADRERLAAAYTEAVSQNVIAAYAGLLEFLSDEYLPAARDSPGLWAMPQGRALYLHKVAEETTLDLTPGEIHALGLRNVVQIESDMAQLLADIPFEGTPAEFRASLRDDARFRFAGAEAMKAEFERVQGVVEAHLPALFGRLAQLPLEFRFVEDFAAPAGAAAYYAMPSPDGARPGIVYLNTHDLASRPTYTTDALQLHEGVPGHHHALSLQVANDALPAFRRFGSVAAFHEGWALYAETLGGQLGLYTDPYRAFGRLSFEAWRASRLVIDTGIHWFGWSREESIAYLLSHTALTETDAVAEVERYIALPAQALSYRLGQRAFLNERARAEEALEERFDIRRFHDALLEEGPMPLGVLEARMSRWIERERGL